jgi:L-amino acid N-acyltransferase YncA
MPTDPAMAAAVVRPATAADAVAVEALVRRAGVRGELSYAEGEPSAATVAALCTDLPPRFTNLTAVAGSAIVGCALISRLYRRDAWNPTADVCLIVDPDHRRGGIGSLLAQATRRHAESVGLRSLVSLARGYPDWLAHWCARHGFAQVGTLPYGEAQQLVVLQALTRTATR